MTQESGSYVSELLEGRFWNDIPGAAAAEYTALWGCSVIISEMSNFSSVQEKREI